MKSSRKATAPMPKDIDPSEAVRAAKKWLAATYADEHVGNVSLEEVRWKGGNWEITLGFLREVPVQEDMAGFVALALAKRSRDYKVVVLAGNDNHVIEMRNREPA